jgi:hypothetical protein
MKALEGAPGIGSPNTIRRRMVQMFEMLRLPEWEAKNLTVSFTTPNFLGWARELGPQYFRWSPTQRCDIRPLAYWAMKVRAEGPRGPRGKLKAFERALAQLRLEAHRLRRSLHVALGPGMRRSPSLPHHPTGKGRALPKVQHHLTDMARRHILERFARGERQSALAVEFNVSRAAISKMVLRRAGHQ